MRNFYIADMHLGHANIIGFDHRPFADVEEMDRTLIDNWNAAVEEKDNIYILGDLMWGEEEKWPEILQRLRGNKILIRGNHDPKNFSQETKKHFLNIFDPAKDFPNPPGIFIHCCHHYFCAAAVQCDIIEARSVDRRGRREVEARSADRRDRRRIEAES